MNKKTKRDLKYVGFGSLIFVLVMGFAFAYYTSAKAQGQLLQRAPTTVPQVQVGTHYSLDIQGKVSGYFTEAYNIGSEHEIIEHKVVSQKGMEVVQKIPGRLKISDIILKRGITNNMDLWTWRQEVVDGKVNSVRRDGSLIMFDKSLKEVARWNFLRAWPSKLIGNPVDASATSPGGGMAIEQVNISVEWIKRVK
jgi:phage tail-like protein